LGSTSAQKCGFTQCSWTVKSIVFFNPTGASDMGLGVLFYVFLLHNLIKCHGIPGTLSKKIEIIMWSL